MVSSSNLILRQYLNEFKTENKTHILCTPTLSTRVEDEHNILRIIFETVRALQKKKYVSSSYNLNYKEILLIDYLIFYLLFYTFILLKI